jgi:sulfopyruvate decarboxylase TPP-binding subunit
VLIIQNTGLLEYGDAFRGTAVEMGVPLLAMIGYRGYRSLSKEHPDSAATFFEPTLRAWKLPYTILEEGRESEILEAAYREAGIRRGPVAVLIP